MLLAPAYSATMHTSAPPVGITTKQHDYNVNSTAPTDGITTKQYNNHVDSTAPTDGADTKKHNNVDSTQHQAYRHLLGKRL